MFAFNRRQLGILGFVLLAVLVTGCARGVAALKPEETPASGTGARADHEVRRVAVGDEFELRLDANASTGCSWQVTVLDEGVVELLSNEYVEASRAEGRLGAAGQAVLRFRALTAGQTVIRLAYGHAWELDQATYDTYELDVAVE